MQLRVRVRAGHHRRQGTPVRLALPQDLVGQSICLKDTRNHRCVRSQVISCGDRKYLCWLLDDVLSGEECILSLETKGKALAEGKEASWGVRLEDQGDTVRLLLGSELVTAYHYRDYRRPYLYPLIGPFGSGMTRDYPMKEDTPDESQDHPHHRSVFTAHGDLSGINNWANGGEMPLGAMEYQEFTALDSGPVLGRLQARNLWTGPEVGPMLDEVREIVLYASAPSYRLLDYRVTLTAREDVVFNDTKEGGILSVRVASSMEVRRGGRIENAQGGVNETEAWGQPSPWCDYSGTVGGRQVGIALMDHPGNLRHPTPWHVRNYGLMTANCFGLSDFTAGLENGDFELKRGETLDLAYRILLHAGDARQGEVSRHYADFAYPPRVDLIRDEETSR